MILSLRDIFKISIIGKGKETVKSNLSMLHK
jgi:hypothetical protein